MLTIDSFASTQACCCSILATHGHVFNGNEIPSMPKVRERMVGALEANLKLARQ